MRLGARDQRMLAAFTRFSYGLDSLTPRELDVARLAAQGYTAIEIGRELHIGERTVESHLAHTYAKLSISSKSQLIRMSQEFVSASETLRTSHVGQPR
jgi:DNA-binding CsgD family transcriptional regulator